MTRALTGWLRARLRAWLGVPEDVVVLVVNNTSGVDETRLTELRRAAAERRGGMN